MTATPVHAGPGALDYFLRQQGCAERDRAVELDGPEGPERAPEGHQHDGHEHGVEGREQESSLSYYTDHVEQQAGDGCPGEERRGEPSGVWLGSGLAAFGFTAGETIREADARAVFERLEHPVTGEALGTRHRRYKSAEAKLKEALEREPDATPERRDELKWQIRGSQSSPVAYWDLAYSAPKSVSVLYAALAVEGRMAEAEKVWEAHREGVAAGLSHVEDTAGWSRRGYHGKAPDGRSVGEWVAANEWTAVRFDHTTSRTGDPQLHSHVLVPNRVQCADTDKNGQPKWRSIDGRGLYQVKRAADAVYQRTMFEALQRDLGVSAVERVDGNGWEIEGVSREVCEAFSSRRGQIEQEVRRYIADYTANHGRAPEARELFMMYKTASLKTRPAKPEPQTQDEQHAQWRATGEELADDHFVDVGEVVVNPERSAGAGATFDRQRVITSAVAEVQLRRASWTAQDLEAAINMKLPIDSSMPEQERKELLDGLVREAVAPGAATKVVGLVPPEVVMTPAAARRSEDGLSRFSRPMPERFATEGQLAAEDRLSAAAGRGGAPVLAPSHIAAVSREIGEVGLNSGQRAAVEGILGSDRQVDVLIGPAGTGKSFTVAALTEVWQREHQAPVLGLATSQIATDVLREDGLDAINTAKFLGAYEPDPETGLPAAELEAGTLLVVDETGMAATEQLDRIQRIAEAAGAKLVFTGDHAQLDAVGAGGALRQLAGEVPTFQLDEVVRFSQDWEREASLGLREGHPSVLQTYDAHGRLFEGDEDAMRTQAKDLFLASRLRGEASLLIVPRNDQAAVLSGELRAQLQAYGVVSTDDTAATALRDGNLAGVGDLIQTRRNDWQNRTRSGRPVVNRDIWRVVERHDDGSVRVEQIDARGRAKTDAGQVTLSGSYLAENTTLAYAVTNHAAQGVTVGQSINIFDVASTREQIYVGMTRGRDGNSAVVISRAEVDDERYVEPLRSDWFQVLTHGLEQDTAQRTATDTLRAELDLAESISALGVAWKTIGDEQNRDRYADILVGTLDPATMDRLDGEDGVDRFWRAVRGAELAGHRPEQLLPQLVTQRSLGDAESVSDVLRHRLHRQVGETPQPVATSWIGRTHGVDNGRGGDLARFRMELAEAMDRRETVLGEQLAEAPPQWALDAPALGPVPDDPIARAQWIERAGAVAGAREWIGAHDLPETVALGPAPSRENPDARAAWERAWGALGAPADQRDYAAASDGELQVMVDRYTREQAWAPAYVADLLRSTEQRRVRYETKATLEEQHLATLTDPDERAASASKLAGFKDHATRQQDRAVALREIHEARQGWLSETDTDRHHAEHAARELQRRNVLTDGPALGQTDNQPGRDGPNGERPSAGEVEAVRDSETARDGHADRDVAGRDDADDREQTPQQRYVDLVTEAEQAMAARATRHQGFVDRLHAAHAQRQTEIDPDGRLDQAGREAAVRADNLTRAAAQVRAEHGQRLDPAGQRDDTELLHARAAEVAAERANAETARAAARQARHDEVHPDQVLTETQRDALADQRAHQHDPRTQDQRQRPEREPDQRTHEDEPTPKAENQHSEREPDQRETHAAIETPPGRGDDERATKATSEPESGRGHRAEPEHGGRTPTRFRTREDLQNALDQAREARTITEQRKAERAAHETERHDRRTHQGPERDRQREQSQPERNPWHDPARQQNNPYDRSR